MQPFVSNSRGHGELHSLVRVTGFLPKNLCRGQGCYGEAAPGLNKTVFNRRKDAGFYIGDKFLHGTGDIAGFAQKVFGKFGRMLR